MKVRKEQTTEKTGERNKQMKEKEKKGTTKRGNKKRGKE
jgi:hypothetical protein